MPLHPYSSHDTCGVLWGIFKEEEHIIKIKIKTSLNCEKCIVERLARPTASDEIQHIKKKKDDILKINKAWKKKKCKHILYIEMQLQSK